MPGSSAVVGVSYFTVCVGNEQVELPTQISKPLLRRNSMRKIQDIPNYLGLTVNRIWIDDSKVRIKVAYNNIILANNWPTQLPSVLPPLRDMLLSETIRVRGMKVHDDAACTRRLDCNY